MTRPEGWPVHSRTICVSRTFAEHACIRAYMHFSIHPCRMKEGWMQCMHAYIHTYMDTDILTSMLSRMSTCIHTYTHTCIQTSVHPYVTCLLYILPYTLSYIPTYLHLLTYVDACMQSWHPATVRIVLLAEDFWPDAWDNDSRLHWMIAAVAFWWSSAARTINWH